MTTQNRRFKNLKTYRIEKQILKIFYPIIYAEEVALDLKDQLEKDREMTADPRNIPIFKKFEEQYTHDINRLYFIKKDCLRLIRDEFQKHITLDEIRILFEIYINKNLVITNEELEELLNKCIFVMDIDVDV